MDIFKYGEEIGFSADYYDWHTGHIYHLTEYGNTKRFSASTVGIHISENGKTIGYVRE